MMHSAKWSITGFIVGAVVFGSAATGVAYARERTTDNDVKIAQTGRGESIIKSARYTDYFTNESGKEREFTTFEFEWHGLTCLLVDEVGSEGGQSLQCVPKAAG